MKSGRKRKSKTFKAKPNETERSSSWIKIQRKRKESKPSSTMDDDDAEQVKRTRIE